MARKALPRVEIALEEVKTIADELIASGLSAEQAIESLELKLAKLRRFRDMVKTAPTRKPRAKKPATVVPPAAPPADAPPADKTLDEITSAALEGLPGLE